jgi:6-phosphofructokinase 1
MKRIAVLTSGGDAPGMNAAIRAVTRAGIDKGLQIFGVREGFRGLMNGDFLPLDARSVGGIITLGGTMLGSARCPEFKDEAVQKETLKRLEDSGISGLIVIGGNGSQTGAAALSRLGFPVVGVASTIDNDLYGSEVTIGVDTALNIALESIDRLRVTALSHRRAFFVEVMGRDCGYLALHCAIVGGAEAVVIPEAEISPEAVADELRAAHGRGKRHAIVVVAEGARYNATRLVNYFKEHHEELGYEARATVLGHVQRGGVPSAFDRMLATRFGAAAIEHFERNEHGVLIGLLNGRVAATKYQEVIANKKTLDAGLLELARILSI